MAGGFTFDKRGWDRLVAHVVLTDLVPRAKKIAAAAEADLAPDQREAVDYAVSTEGPESQRLDPRDYRASVIAVGRHARRAQAKRNTLLRALDAGKTE